MTPSLSHRLAVDAVDLRPLVQERARAASQVELPGAVRGAVEQAQGQGLVGDHPLVPGGGGLGIVLREVDDLLDLEAVPLQRPDVVGEREPVEAGLDEFLVESRPDHVGGEEPHRGRQANS